MKPIPFIQASSLALLVGAPLAAGCIPTPAGADDSGDTSTEGTSAETEGTSDTGEPEGLDVDASDPDAWVYLRIDGTEIQPPAAPEDSPEWDLAFRRTQIKTNSGTSGTRLAGGRLAPDSLAYEEVTASPTTGFVRDALLPIPGPPGSGEFSGNAVLSDWFDYDESTHQVSPKPRVFLVRSAEGDYAKLEVRAYADGVFTLGLDLVERDVNLESLVVDASDDAAWVFVDLKLAGLVEPAEPTDDDGWDIALSRTMIQTNSGTSGSGMGGALDPMQADLDAIDAAPTDGYAVDEMLPLPGPPGSGEFSGNPVLGGWYDYDAVNHIVTPKDMAFVVRTVDGGYTKLEILGYEDGVYSLDWAYAGAGRSDF